MFTFEKVQCLFIAKYVAKPNCKCIYVLNLEKKIPLKTLKTFRKRKPFQLSPAKGQRISTAVLKVRNFSRQTSVVACQNVENSRRESDWRKLTRNRPAGTFPCGVIQYLFVRGKRVAEYPSIACFHERRRRKGRVEKRVMARLKKDVTELRRGAVGGRQSKRKSRKSLIRQDRTWTVDELRAQVAELTRHL